MELNNMHPTPGSRAKKDRVGRGDKTAKRGENGQKSRAGYSKKIGFEGGQNPLYRRIPKRGFHSLNRTEVIVVNLSRIAALKEKEISLELLVEKKIIKSNYKSVKILGELGSAKLPKNIKINAHAFSKSALKAIEEVQGKANIIE